MTTALKQRLTGALVLLAVGLILWPMLFEEPYSRHVDTRSEIPVEPPLAVLTLETPRPLYADRPLETGPYAPEPEAELPLPALDPVPTAAVPPPAVQAPAPSRPAAAPAAASPPAAAVSDGSRLGLDQRQLPERWTIQMASLREEKSALALRERLVTKGYPAYLRDATVKGQRYYRVYVGPRIDRQAAEALQQTLNREFGVQSIVVRYDP